MALYAKYKTLGKEENHTDFEVEIIKNLERRNEIIATNKLVVIDNYTTWCGPCQQIASPYAKLAQKYNKESICVLVKENVEDNIGNWPNPVRGVPCFHFYLNGNFLPDYTIVGASLANVEENIKKIIN